MTTPEPGLYPGTPYAAYASWDARRASVLKAAAKSCAHLRLAALRVEDDDTKDTALGSGVHCAILEPDRFEQLYRPALELPRRGKANTEAHARHALAHLGHELLPAKDFERCLRIRDAVYRKPWAEALLGGSGSTELSVVWTDPGSGVRCKSRIDRYAAEYGGLPACVEFKTFRGDPVAKDWQREVVNRCYDLQGFMQLEGLTQATGQDTPRRLIWVVLEKKEPYESALFSPHELELDRYGELVLRDTNVLEEGGRLFHQAVGLWAECTRSGNWPGYSVKPQRLELPPWGARKALTSTTAVQHGDDSEELF